MAISSKVETVNDGSSKMKIGAAALFFLAGIVAFYLLGSEKAWLQWLALLACFAVAVGLFLISAPGVIFRTYFRDSFLELKKVVWPARKEAIQMTGYVFAFAVVMALFLWLTDMLVGWSIFDLILGWRD